MITGIHCRSRTANRETKCVCFAYVRLIQIAVLVLEGERKWNDCSIAKGMLTVQIVRRRIVSLEDGGISKDRVWAAGWGKKGSDTSFQLVRTGASGLANELPKESGPWMLLMNM